MVTITISFAIGWDAAMDDVVPSAPLSAATWTEILHISASSLSGSGLNVDANELFTWHQNLGDVHSEDEPLGTLRVLQIVLFSFLSPDRAFMFPLITTSR